MRKPKLVHGCLVGWFLLIVSCDIPASDDELTSGSTVVELGLDFVAQGITNYQQGHHEEGIEDMARGMRMLDGGLETMHVDVENFDGVDHPMMWGCDELHEEMMNPLDSEMVRLHENFALLTDDDATNDDDAVHAMDPSVRAMQTRMDAVDMTHHCSGEHSGHL